MMKKKLLVIFVAAAVVAGMTNTVSGSANLWDPSTDQEDATWTGDPREPSPQIEDDVPVYGYVGPDAYIIDPDPTDPDEPPVTGISVSVPVKILWAVFESDYNASAPSYTNNVTSPAYHIKNNSSTVDLDVSIVDFDVAGADSDTTTVSPDLTLRFMKGSSAAGTLYSGTALAAPFSIGTIVKTEDAVGGNDRINFTIGGEYQPGGAFPTSELWPVYTMTVAFELA